jgi:hypothetical protein
MLSPRPAIRTSTCAGSMSGLGSVLYPERPAPVSLQVIATRATLTGALSEDGLDHYAVGMKDPEGNEFGINVRPANANHLR